MPLNKLQQIQLQQFKAIVTHSYKRVPYYRRRFDEAGVRPQDIRTLEDISKFPIMTKAEIQSISPIDITTGNLNECRKRTTSGSTGMPLTVFADKTFLQTEQALVARAYFENGVRLWDRIFRIVEPEEIPHRQRLPEKLGILPTKYVSIFDDVEKQRIDIERYKPHVLRGYASALEVLADVCKENGLKSKPRLVFTGAEFLDARMRQSISSVFETDPFDLYSACEFGLMGWECREHSGYHLNVEGVLMEVIRNGDIAGPDEQGEIVCTGLVNKTMPLIRYKIGDVGALSDKQCQCGINLPLLKIIGGRVGDFLMTTSGKMIPPTLFFPYPFDDVAWIKQFRVIQERRNTIVIEVVLRNGFNASEQKLEAARAKIKHLFGEDMEVIFSIVDQIKPDPSGKLRKIISKVPTNLNVF